VRRLLSALSVCVLALVLGVSPSAASTAWLSPAGGVAVAEHMPPTFSAFAVAGGVPTKTSRLLSLQGVGDMVFDPANGHVLITGDPAYGNSSILVTDYTGATVTTITGIAGGGGMVVDGTKLYVARCGWGLIDVYDLGTLTKTDSITAAVSGTCDLALAGGRLWFSNATGSGTLTSVTVDAPHTTATHGNFYYPIFATSSGAPDTLIVGESGQSPSYVYVYDVSGGGFTLLKLSMDMNGASNLQSLAATADGTKLFTASGSPYQGQGFTLPDLTPSGIFPTAPYPSATAVTDAGGHLAVGEDGIYEPDVWVFATDNATPLWKFDFGTTDNTVWPDGVRFTPDESALFVLSGDVNFAHSVRLTVFSDPTKTPGSLTVSAGKATVPYGGSVKVTAHLGTASAQKTVSVYRQPAGGARTLVATGTVDGAGNFSAPVALKRNTTFTAEWVGDATYGKTTSAGRKVGVTLLMAGALSGAYGRSGNYRLFHYHSSCASGRGCPVYAATVKPSHAGKPVTFVLQRRTASGWSTVGQLALKLNKRSAAAVIFRYTAAAKGKAFRMQAVYKGDTANVRSGTRWAYIKITA
jgi:hypothetical protein